MYEHKNINNKDIYIVESHHHVLKPWAQIRSTVNQDINLITLDNHTDTHPAFLNHAHDEDKTNDELKSIRKDLIAKIDFQNNTSVIAAISNLKNDEHIHAATMSGIINYAFVIYLNDEIPTQSIEEEKYHKKRCCQLPNKDGQFTLQYTYRDDIKLPQRPFTYTPPKEHIFQIPKPECTILGCTKSIHDDECDTECDNQVLESIYLNDQLSKAKEMANSVGINHLLEIPYILDIDLDFFHSHKSVSPEDPSTFFTLIEKAKAITIAKESTYVEDLKHEKEDIDSKFLLEKTLEHIKNALSSK